MSVHVVPPSVVRYRPLRLLRRGTVPPSPITGSPALATSRGPLLGLFAVSASTSAYTTFGLLGATAMPMRPLSTEGKPPLLISVQLFPPSVVFQSPEPGPPLLR